MDTSAFVALRNRAEREHEQARDSLRRLVHEEARLYTSNLVFAETYVALLVRVGRGEAIGWGRRFRAGTSIEMIRIDETIEDAAWQILEDHPDKRWSYVDATSFALIDQEGGREAFALDHHFTKRGLLLI